MAVMASGVRTFDTVSEGPAGTVTATPGQIPSVDDLISEFRRTLSEGSWVGYNERDEDTRMNIWDGQSDDGRKWDANLKNGKKAFPWDGASDSRTFLADDVCNENADQKYAAFWRAVARLQAVGAEDLGGAAGGSKFLDWYIHGPERPHLDTEAELSAQYDEGFGWFGLHILWDRVIGRRMRKIKMEDLLAMAQRAPQMAAQNPELADVLNALPHLVSDEDMESEASKAVQYLYDLYARANLPEEVMEREIIGLSNRRARKAVRELRNDGETELPLPYLCKNTPTITAMKPYRDILFPSETGDVQDASVVFVRCFDSEARVRELALADDWDEKWVEQAVKTRGKYSIWTPSPHGFDTGRYEWAYRDGKSWLIEYVYAYYKTIDEDGISQVQYTVFSPHVRGDGSSASCAIQKPLGFNHGKYPVVIGRRERIDRQISTSRSTPYMLQTWQNIKKSQLDSIVDLTSIGVVPPALIPKGVVGQKLKFGPAVQNEYTPGREYKMMDIPTRGAVLAFETLQALRLEVGERFGRFMEGVSPMVSQLKLETRTGRFLLAWSEAFNQLIALTCQFDPKVWKDVTGQPAPDPDLAPQDYVLHFDAAQLHPDLMVQKLEALGKLRLQDAAGVIDAAKFVRMAMEAIDPTMARALVSDTAGASEKILRETQDDLSAMSAGMPAIPRDASNDPTAPMRLKFAVSLLHFMPRERVMEPDFQKNMQTYLKNLQMGAAQQQNKIVGRLGVQPR